MPLLLIDFRFIGPSLIQFFKVWKLISSPIPFTKRAFFSLSPGGLIEKKMPRGKKLILRKLKIQFQKFLDGFQGDFRGNIREKKNFYCVHLHIPQSYPFPITFHVTIIVQRTAR